MYDCSKCAFNSEFDFAVDLHVKLDHPLYPRKDLFECLQSSIEMHLCPKRDYASHSKIDLHNHLTRVHTLGNTKSHKDSDIIKKMCDNCNFKTFSDFRWFLHELWRETERKCVVINKHSYECDKCVFKTREKHNLKRHQISKHMSDDEIKWSHCSHCSYKAKLSQTLLHHIRVKHTSNNLRTYLKCDQCSFITYENCNLSRHKVRKHSVKSEDKKETVVRFDCAQCSYKSKYESWLARHILRKHTADDLKIWLECDQCEFKTFEKESLERHVYAKHTEDDKIKWFYCVQCAYKAKRKSHLAQHVGGVHSINANIRCDQCSFRTTVQYKLRRHQLKTHTN